MNELIEYKEMREAIQRIRELHKGKQRWKLVPHLQVCAECSKWNYAGRPVMNIAYPCRTIKALGGPV
jgi:hypothetical protein